MTLELHPTGSCWVKLTVDGRPVIFARLMAAGEKEIRSVRDEATIEVGDAGAFAFSIDGRPGKPLGQSRSGPNCTHYEANTRSLPGITLPMEPGLRSTLIDLFRRGEAARDVRLLAAQGALAPRAEEQLALLILLVDDAGSRDRVNGQRNT